MKLKAIKIFLCLMFVLVILTAPVIAFGDEPQPGTKTYESMAPIEGLSPVKGQVINLSQYLENLYVFLISFAALAAVVMITIGGFTYLTSAAAGSKEDGKSMIRNAISGLLLLIFSWLIINTINPEALKFKFFTSVQKGTGYTGTGGARLIFTDVMTGEKFIKVYIDRNECEEDKAKLMKKEIPKYIFPELEQCKPKNVEDGDKIFTFKYTYSVTPSSDYVAPESVAEDLPTSFTEVVTETTKESCEQKRKIIAEKSNIRKPYYVNRECKKTIWSLVSEDKYAFTVKYPFGEENNSGGWDGEYNSRQFVTIEECGADKTRVSTAVEPYVHIDEQCTEGKYNSDSSSSKKTSTLLYCQIAIVEVTASGMIEKEYCFKTATDCKSDLTTKKTAKERAYRATSCLQN